MRALPIPMPAFPDPFHPVVMLSIDVNILLYAYSVAAPEHDRALSFIITQSTNSGVALSEFVLAEFYRCSAIQPC